MVAGLGPAGLLGGLGLAAATGALAGAAISGPPYWDAGLVNSWLVAFAIGVFLFLASVPSAARRALGRRGDRAGRGWGGAMAVWAVAGLAVAALGVLMAGAAGLDGDSLLGIAGAVLVVEGATVVVLVGALVLLGAG